MIVLGFVAAGLGAFVLGYTIAWAKYAPMPEDDYYKSWTGE